MSIKRKIFSLLNKNKYRVNAQRLDDKQYFKHESGISKILNLLNYTKTSSTSYSAGGFSSGYHSFEINGYSFKGQRNPKLRLENIPFSFDDLTVLDIGCNQGGMLYELANKIKHGVGIDYDSRMINAANKIKSYTKNNNLDYYVFDLETENLDYIKDFLQGESVDVVFLLSICMWIKNWKQVIDFASTVSPLLIFESNGKEKQQKEQFNYLEQTYELVKILDDSSEDDPLQKNRKLYYCTNKQ